jgi:hypothetical protein
MQRLHGVYVQRRREPGIATDADNPYGRCPCREFADELCRSPHGDAMTTPWAKVVLPVVEKRWREIFDEPGWNRGWPTGGKDFQCHETSLIMFVYAFRIRSVRRSTS